MLNFLLPILKNPLTKMVISKASSHFQHKAEKTKIIRAAEIESIKSLARDFKVNIENIKVDRRDTFLPLNQALNKDGFALERHTLSFQLSGKFISIGEFLEDQNNKFENILLSQCVFNMDSLDPKGVVAQLEFNIYGNKQ